MKAALYQYRNGRWAFDDRHLPQDTVQLVLGFGSKRLLADPEAFHHLKEQFPAADIALCSTAGEIMGTEVFDDTISVTAISFDTATVRSHSIRLQPGESSAEAGKRLAAQFDTDGLVSVVILSDGSHVNGGDLVDALCTVLPERVLITGGLAGDGSDFHYTLTGLNEPPAEYVILGIGFYGDKLQVNHGSRGGWETFGLEKTVTRSKDNVLYEIEHNSALGLYKRYLGEDAAGLPGAALLFPLSVTLPDTGETVVRTILSIDAEEGSMTFAGNIPEGARIRLMRANFDKLVGAASDAAAQAAFTDTQAPQLALLISCVGRKLILKNRTEEETEAIDEIFGHHTPLVGFYSYGEISPVARNGQCQLHNQTMTITTFYETE